MRTIHRALARMAFAAGALAVAFAANAQENYPDKPITIVVPFPPGGSTDVSARALVPKMTELLGQPVVIDNRPGSGGNVGTGYVARAKPDGYALLWTVNPSISMNKHMFKDLPYDPQKDLTPISLAATTLMALVVHPSLPVTTVAELVEYTKANPGKVKFGSAGIGSAHHINGEVMNKEAGLDMVHVPYPGGGPAIADLVGGHIPVSFGTLPAVLPHAESGALRILALAEDERYEKMPDVPTIAETIPGVGVNTWIGFMAPGGTPKPIVDKLHGALMEALKEPEVIALYEKSGLLIAAQGPDELKAIIASDLDKYEKLFPEIGIEKQ